jgi:hypothetical protein
MPPAMSGEWTVSDQNMLSSQDTKVESNQPKLLHRRQPIISPAATINNYVSRNRILSAINKDIKESLHTPIKPLATKELNKLNL